MEQINDPFRYLALAVIYDAICSPLYSMSEHPNVYIVNNHPITFTNLLWLLDPRTRDFWFEIAQVDFYAVRKKLLKTDAFQMLMEKIKKNEVGARYYEKKLIEFGVLAEVDTESKVMRDG